MNPKIQEIEKILNDAQLIRSAIIKAGQNPTKPLVNEIAMQVAHDAVITHNPDKGMSLSSWVYQNIIWLLKRKLGKESTNCVSLDVVNGNDDERTLLDKVAAPDNTESTVVDTNYIQSVMGNLDERGKFIISFLLNAPTKRCYQQLGEALAKSGLTKMTSEKGQRSYAQALAKRYLNKVKAILHEMGQKE